MKNLQSTKIPFTGSNIFVQSFISLFLCGLQLVWLLFLFILEKSLEYFETVSFKANDAAMQPCFCWAVSSPGMNLAVIIFTSPICWTDLQVAPQLSLVSSFHDDFINILTFLFVRVVRERSARGVHHQLTCHLFWIGKTTQTRVNAVLHKLRAPQQFGLFWIFPRIMCCVFR